MWCRRRCDQGALTGGAGRPAKLGTGTRGGPNAPTSEPRCPQGASPCLCRSLPQVGLGFETRRRNVAHTCRLPLPLCCSRPWGIRWASGQHGRRHRAGSQDQRAGLGVRGRSWGRPPPVGERRLGGVPVLAPCTDGPGRACPGRAGALTPAAPLAFPPRCGGWEVRGRVAAGAQRVGETRELTQAGAHGCGRLHKAPLFDWR